MNQKNVKIAVIGYGGMGGWHCNKIATIEGLELAGIYDILEERRAVAEEKGIQIGIEQGIKQGIQEGIQREKIETVLRLKSLGLNVEQIAKGTCTSESEVEKIIRENIN